MCFSLPAQTWGRLTEKRTLDRHLTEKRTLHPSSHGKPHSATGDSRKDALWGLTLTQKRILHRRRHLDVTKRRILDGRRHRKAHFACGAHQKAHSVSEQSRRVRLSVRARAQNALFRRVCFSLPAQTWSHLTQRRILRRRSHVKAQSAPDDSRKSALWGCRSHGKAHSAPATPPRRDGKPHFALESDRRSPRPIHTSRAPYGR